MDENLNKNLTVEPFIDGKDYLDNLIMLETVRLQLLYNSEMEEVNEKPRSINKFLPSSEEIGWIITSKVAERTERPDHAVIAVWEEYIEERRQATYASEQELILDNMIAHLSLSDFGRSVIVLSFMAAVDRDYRTIIQFLGGDVDKQYPSIELCAKLYFDHERDNSYNYVREILPEIRSLEIVFPNLSESKALYTEPLIPDQRLIAYILGEKDGNQSYIKNITGNDRLEVLLHRDNEFNALCDICRDDKNDHLVKWVMLYGEKGAGKKHLIKHLAAFRRRKVIQLDLSYFEISNSEKEELVNKAACYAIREMIMEGGILAISGMEELEPEVKNRFILYVKEKTLGYRGIVFFLFDKEEEGTPGDDFLNMGLNPLDEFKRKELWEVFSKEHTFSEDIDLWALSNTFAFTAGQIQSALKSADIISSNNQGAIDRENLYKACYNQIDHKLEEKAKRVKVRFAWEDLKLPREEKKVLREICDRVKNKHIVMSQWKFIEKLPYGAGIPVVFAGPPGTGKTMAAQVIANELHMEMYQIDLSQLVDKYIGETEKNIKAVFDQAQKSNSILFFDEADALFGKRLEGSSSNDRYANIESSILLQCIETYNGISILATNNYSAIDAAFVRRFKYLINFRAPDAELRREIWESVFPSAAPIVEDVNFEWLAKNFQLTGAFIKNIALTAAFLAAEDGSDINLLHILKGLKRELIKEGRNLGILDLGEYGYLYSEL